MWPDCITGSLWPSPGELPDRPGDRGVLHRLLEPSDHHARNRHPPVGRSRPGASTTLAYFGLVVGLIWRGFFASVRSVSASGRGGCRRVLGCLYAPLLGAGGKWPSCARAARLSQVTHISAILAFATRRTAPNSSVIFLPEGGNGPICPFWVP